MTQHNTSNIKIPNSQLNTFKSGIKNGMEVTLNLSSNVILMISLILCIDYY